MRSKCDNRDMQADYDLDDSGNAIPTRGGRRPGAGRPKGTGNEDMRRLAAAAELDPDLLDPDSDDRTTIAVRKAKATADKEEALAGLKALELKIETGKYLPRDAFREASATALATLSQGLRSIPDTLERRYNLTPDVLQAIEVTVDDALSQVADTLALFTEARP